MWCTKSKGLYKKSPRHQGLSDHCDVTAMVFTPESLEGGAMDVLEAIPQVAWLRSLIVWKPSSQDEQLGHFLRASYN